MNRPIKFRAWEGDRMNYNVSLYPNGEAFWENKEMDMREVSSEVMQFTGLTDKNGKEIYEGDLLKSTANRKVWEVVWRNASWCVSSVRTKLPDFLTETYTFADHKNLLRKVGGEYEVIGNIYENPELAAPKKETPPSGSDLPVEG